MYFTLDCCHFVQRIFFQFVKHLALLAFDFTISEPELLTVGVLHDISRWNPAGIQPVQRGYILNSICIIVIVPKGLEIFSFILYLHVFAFI